MSDLGEGVQLRGVTLGYGLLRRQAVISDLDLAAPPRQITAIVGANGVGKTTLFRALFGILRPWKGEVRIDGLEPTEHRLRRGTGYLPDAVALPAGYTVRAFLEEGASLSGLEGVRADEAIERALIEVDLSPLAARPLRSLSKGLGRRAALAFALLGHPAVLLLDEPLSGLDSKSRAGLRETIRRAPANGTTVVMASHDLAEVQRTADLVYVLDQGRIVRRVDRAELEVSDLETLVLEREVGT